MQRGLPRIPYEGHKAQPEVKVALRTVRWICKNPVKILCNHANVLQSAATVLDFQQVENQLGGKPIRKISPDPYRSGFFTPEKTL